MLAKYCSFFVVVSKNKWFIYCGVCVSESEMADFTLSFKMVLL